MRSRLWIDAVKGVAVSGGICVAQTFAQTPPNLTGDVGAAIYKTPAITKSVSQNSVLLPYVYADYGSLYARVDTYGYKVTPIGAGHFEITTRLSFEGYEADVPGIGRRPRPKPLGLGTFQETPYGAFIFYAFRDIASGGRLMDVSYAAELVVGDMHVYPQIGVERRDAKYVNSLYGIGLTDAQRSGLTTYIAGASTSPNAAIAMEYPLANNLKLTLQLRKRWLDKSIYASPLVEVKQQTSAFVAISQTFK